MKRTLIPSMPHNLPSLSSPAWVLMIGLLIVRSVRFVSRRLERGVGDDHGQTEKQPADDGHLAHS